MPDQDWIDDLFKRSVEQPEPNAEEQVEEVRGLPTVDLDAPISLEKMWTRWSQTMRDLGASRGQLVVMEIAFMRGALTMRCVVQALGEGILKQILSGDEASLVLTMLETESRTRATKLWAELASNWLRDGAGFADLEESNDDPE